MVHFNFFSELNVRTNCYTYILNSNFEQIQRDFLVLMSNANATFFSFCEQLLSTYLNIEKCSETAKEHFVHTIPSVHKYEKFSVYKTC